MTRRALCAAVTAVALSGSLGYALAAESAATGRPGAFTGASLTPETCCAVIIPPHACENEDAGVWCTWDAGRQGNGRGESGWYDARGEWNRFQVHQYPGGS